MSTTYEARLHPLGKPADMVVVRQFTLVEPQHGGWVADVAVDPPSAISRSVEQTYGMAMSSGFAPGAPVVLRLISSDSETNSAITVQTWPSMVMRVITVKTKTPGVMAYSVRLCDPLRIVAQLPIWGVFKTASAGAMVGGAITLALGGDGAATLTPTLPGMPTVTITERLREAIDEIPFSIAAGAPFAYWLADFLARLGARLEYRADKDGSVTLTITDSVSTEEAAAMTLTDSGDPGWTSMRLVKMDNSSGALDRASMLDNVTTGDALRIGFGATVDQIIEAAHINLDEAAVRADFFRKRENAEAGAVHFVSSRPVLHPWSKVSFTNKTVLGTQNWQAGSVSHYFKSSAYYNLATMYKTAQSWHPVGPEDTGDIYVPAIVDDGVSTEVGKPVPRDREGRIPVRFPFLTPPAPSETTDSTETTESTDESTEATWAGPVVSLPVSEPMGGGTHGFLPAHRQGDPCRVAVRSPFYAEIIGFGYRDDQRVAESLVDATAGIVVRRDSEGWKGVVFRPNTENGAA